LSDADDRCCLEKQVWLLRCRRSFGVALLWRSELRVRYLHSLSRLVSRLCFRSGVEAISIERDSEGLRGVGRTQLLKSTGTRGGVDAEVCGPFATARELRYRPIIELRTTAAFQPDLPVGLHRMAACTSSWFRSLLRQTITSNAGKP